jgi:Ca2+-binding RTX toxin-like protein
VPVSRLGRAAALVLIFIGVLAPSPASASSHVFQWSGTDANEHVVVGTDGINLDADQNNGIDVSLDGVTQVVLNGMGGNDILSGAGGHGTGGEATVQLVIDGGTGSDELAGGAAADDISGGSGFDSMSYEIRTAGVEVILDDVQNDGAKSGEGDLVWYDVEQVIGGSGPDHLAGTGTYRIANTLFGMGGKDLLEGAARDDTLYGGAKADTLHGGNDDDMMEGGLGNDVEWGEGGNENFRQNPITVYESPDTPKTIQDGDCINSTLTVMHPPTTPSGEARDVNVRVDIEHASEGDLKMQIIGPRENPGWPDHVNLLSQYVEDTSSEYTGTYFDSEAFHRIVKTDDPSNPRQSPRPLDGRFHPQTSFDSAYRGINADGDWTLRVCDDLVNGEEGILNWWTLEISHLTGKKDGNDELHAGCSGGCSVSAPDGNHDMVDYTGRLKGLNLSFGHSHDGSGFGFSPLCDGQAKECDDIDNSFEDVYAGVASDNIWGNDWRNDLRGHRGNDFAWAFGECDRFRGGLGNDYFDAGDDNDPCQGQQIVMENGDDTVLGGDGNDVLDAGPDDDYVDGGPGIDTAKGGSGQDECYAETRIDCELP